MTKRVALYARVSTVRQAEGDLSIPDQKRAIVAYCKQRDWTIIADYVDAGVSATDDNRPEFQRMVEDAIRHQPGFDVIVVHSYSRYFRDNLQAELYRRHLKKAGVEVISITQEFGDGPTADLIRQVIGLMDEHQSKENAKHTLRGMEENARQGFVNGRAPFGYRAVVTETRGTKAKKRLEIDPAEAEIVKLIFQLARSGVNGIEPAGVKAIAKELNRRNLTTRNGRRFSVQVVHDILHRSAYIGRHVFNVTDSRTKLPKPSDKHIVVPVPAIIDEAMFEAVQASMRDRDPMRVQVRFSGHPTLLSNLARCATCGGAMTLRSGKSGRYRYYTCSTAHRFGTSSCSGRTVRESLLDNLVVDHLADVVFEPTRLRAVLESAIANERKAQKDAPRQRDTLLTHKVDLDARIARMHQAIERGLVAFDDTEFAERLRSLKVERAEIDRQIAHLRSVEIQFPPLTVGKVRAFSAVLRSCLRTGEIGARRGYLRLFLDRVVLDDHEVRLHGHSHILTETYAREWNGAVPPQIMKWRPRGDSNTRPTV